MSSVGSLVPSSGEERDCRSVGGCRMKNDFSTIFKITASFFLQIELICGRNNKR